MVQMIFLLNWMIFNIHVDFQENLRVTHSNATP